MRCRCHKVVVKLVPETNESLVVRTDFSDEAAWESLCFAIRNPIWEYRAYLEFINDREFEGVTSDTLPDLIPRYPYRSFAFVIDKAALSQSEHPILVVDLRAEPGRTFRVIPSVLYEVENNLSLSNLDFCEFADAAGKDGIYRGF